MLEGQTKRAKLGGIMENQSNYDRLGLDQISRVMAKGTVLALEAFAFAPKSTWDRSGSWLYKLLERMK